MNPPLGTVSTPGVQKKNFQNKIFCFFKWFLVFSFFKEFLEFLVKLILTIN